MGHQDRSVTGELEIGMIRHARAVTTPVQVEIWSDVVCPWCYIGKRRFETAVAAFGHPVEVVWRSYELDPGAPALRAGSNLERIARKYGTTVEKAEAQHRRITDLAVGEGLDYHLDQARSGSSFDAHRLLHLAGARGIQDAVKERLLAGYLEEGVAIGLSEELAPLAVSAGLDAAEVDAVLSGDAYGDDVRADEARAIEIGITGVPFFVVDERFAIPGAQDPDTILGALERAWSRRTPQVVDGTDPSAFCADDSCPT
jgi:predicted DsbA family dithiol-disulfide isomerase